MSSVCGICGAKLTGAIACRTLFDQMLYWEAEHPRLGTVHHLMVLAYHLQHPHLYSADGLALGKRLLVDFVESGIDPQEARRKRSSNVASDQRKWKVTARPGDKGTYRHPVVWSMTATDVSAGGDVGYIERVRRWAAAILQDLKKTENLA